MKTVSLGNISFDLPDAMETRIEGDTLVAYPRGTDFIYLRFTAVIVRKDNKEVLNAGEDFVREMATQANAKLQEADGKVWLYSTKPSSEGGPGSLLHCWDVGMGGNIIIISCLVDEASRSIPFTNSVLRLVEPAIRSLRSSPS